MTNEIIELIRPFGPLVAKVKLSDALVNYLNDSLDSSLNDFSNQLVGKVKEELAFSEEISQHVINELAPIFAQYHTTHKAGPIGQKVKVDVKAGWFVRQFEGEYNPLHVHTNSNISCVGYLSLPENIEKEWEEDEKDHHPSHGRIEFAYSNSVMSYSRGTIMIKPQVGDFYIFPNGLWHTVYPFYTKGERRSFSMNLVCENIEEENQ